MATKKHPSYTFTKNGIYYYSRAVPMDLRQHYASARLVYSLRTRSRSQALVASKSLSLRLDQYWLTLRMNDKDVPLGHLLVSSSGKSKFEDMPDLKAMLAIYLEQRGKNKNENFHGQNKKAVEYFIKVIGNRKLSQITSKEAALYRDWLVKRGLKMSSVHRYYSVLRAITGFVISENGLDLRNPFVGVYLPPKYDSESRLAIKGKNLEIIQSKCRELDDDIRHLLALISDSGMRLGEAVGLLKSDINIDAAIPHLIIQEHPHRRLKTKASRRLVPLVGLSLWAAKRVLETNESSNHCFPRYSNDDASKPDAASGNFSVWLKANIAEGATIHGLRHGFRDRLRDAKVPTEAIDQMGGWSKRSVGAGYGDGYSLEVLHEFMKRITN